MRKKLAEYIQKELREKDIELCAVDYTFTVNFYSYLTIYRKEILCESSAMKQMSLLKQIMAHAEDKKMIDRTPFITFEK